MLNNHVQCILENDKHGYIRMGLWENIAKYYQSSCATILSGDIYRFQHFRKGTDCKFQLHIN